LIPPLAGQPTTAPLEGSDTLVGAGVQGGLLRLYAEYRRREAADLLSLIPREAIRPLYRVAREDVIASGAALPDDPVALLVDWVEHTLLPLPTFAVWLEDYGQYRTGHLGGALPQPEAPDGEAPVTVEVRTFRVGEVEWHASLNLFRREPGWSAFIAFSHGERAPEARTADIFREDDPALIRDRFLGFGPRALEAFLRSSLP